MNWQLASMTALPSHEASRRLFFFHERLPRGARNIHHAYAPVEKLGTVFADEPCADVVAYVCLPKNVEPPYTFMITGHLRFS